MKTQTDTKNATPILSIKNLSYAYENNEMVLTDINFDILEGDFLGIIGPNGGGKSTLLKLIMGIMPLQKGTVELFGKPITEFREWHLIGYVSQKAAHFDKRFPATVREVVSMGRIARKGLFKWFTEEDTAAVTEALEDVNMLEKIDAPLYQLSGGQQQRIFIARALASRPRLIVLDEPTIGIDLRAQEQFYLLLQQLRQQKKLTIILVSHDIDVVASQANSFACVNQNLVYHGKPEDFIKQDYMEKLYGKNVRLILHGH